MKKDLNRLINECVVGDIVVLTVGDLVDGHAIDVKYKNHLIDNYTTHIDKKTDKIKICGVIIDKEEGLKDKTLGGVLLAPISKKGRYIEFDVDVSWWTIKYKHLSNKLKIHADTCIKVSNACSCKLVGRMPLNKVIEVSAAGKEAELSGAFQRLGIKN